MKENFVDPGDCTNIGRRGRFSCTLKVGRLWIFFLMIFLLINYAKGQNRIMAVTGTVTDQKGIALPGVSVKVKGTTNGTMTNTEGKYTLRISGNDITLVFSFIGYESQEKKFTGSQVMNIVMKETSSLMNEVVVIGYGTQSKRKVAGSLAKVSGNDFKDIPATTPADAMLGLASGVQVQAGSGGSPGSVPAIRIRGMSSLGSSNEPLYVVDGYPLPDAGQFNRINPSDIESIEILKDAASAAIYGSRASNGVVIVTTRRGQAGKSHFELSAYTGVQQIAKKLDLANKDEYLNFAKETARLRNVKYPDLFDHPDSLPDTDWQDVIFRTAPMSEYSLSATGGTEKIRYSASGSYTGQEGTLVGTDYKQGTFRLNLDANLSSKLKLGVNLAPSYGVQNRQQTSGSYNAGNAIYTAMLMYPIIPVRYANGNYAQPNGSSATTQNSFLQTNLYNPLAMLELRRDNIQVFRLLSNTFLEWEPVVGLKLKTQAGLSYENSQNDYYIPSTLASDAAPTASLTNPVLNSIQARLNSTRVIDYLWENTATYTKNVGKHNFNGLLVYSIQKYRSTENISTGATGSFTNDLVENPTAASTINGSINYGLNSFLSFAARLNYDYDARYIFSAALRTDGSSRFGSEERFGYFPSFSGAWRISEEPFFSGVKNLVNELKVRASYGETGNAGIGDFAWQNRMIQSNYSFGNSRQAGVEESGFLNTRLTWEKVKAMDIGFEAGFLRDRIYFTADYYKKTTSGMLFNRGLPALVGYSTTITSNIGAMWNKGLEFALSTKNLVGNFKWSSDFNISFNSNKVTSLDGRNELDYMNVANFPNVYRIKVGDPIGNIYGLKMLGVYKDQADLDNSPKWTAGSRIGDNKAWDANGDGKVDAQDYIVLGNGLPDFTYGFSNRFSYKNFDAMVVLQGSYGNSILNGASQHSTLSRGVYNVVKDMLNNYYDMTKGNGDAKYARPDYAGLNTASETTSYAVEDGSFLRIRSVSLGYTLPTAVAHKLKIQNARVYISGLNLYTFTNYSGYNPEPSLNGNTAYTPGADQATYPANRSITIGLNVGF